MSSGRILDGALLLVLTLTGVTWLLVDGAVPASVLTTAVFVATVAKAAIVMSAFMELWRGPRWALMGLCIAFGGTASALSLLMG
ncbi:MAG: hypothetical protein KC502_13615 [Myxococcales bacterium]|nr:hypothetical protein [Myxococcales bacterium]